MNTIATSALDRAKTAFVTGQLACLIALIICIGVDPHGLVANAGFSYYGGEARTIVPYYATFFLAGVTAAAMVIVLPTTRRFHAIRGAFAAMILCFIGLLATPYNATPPVIGGIHDSFGTVLFGIQFLLAGWLALTVLPKRLRLPSIVVLTSAGLLALASLYDLIPIEIEAQLIFQFVFSFVVIRWLSLSAAQR